MARRWPQRQGSTVVRTGTRTTQRLPCCGAVAPAETEKGEKEMTKLQIEPCPFCGLDATWGIQSDDGKEYFVECAVCKATGPKVTLKGLAYHEWNQRRPPMNEPEAKHEN